MSCPADRSGRHFFAGSADRRVGQGPEIASGHRGPWANPYALRHQDPDHVLLRVRCRPRCHSRRPSRTCRAPPTPSRRVTTASPKPQPWLSQKPGKNGDAAFCSGGDLVGRHQLDRRARQDALAAVPAVVQHHLAEGEIVVDRRDQPAAAGRERRRAGSTGRRGLVEHLERAGLRDRSSSWSRADRASPRGTLKPVSFMPSGSKIRSRRNVVERLAGGARDQHAEHVGAGVVQPLLARLVDQRQRCRAPHPLVRRRRAGGRRPGASPAPPSPSGSGTCAGDAITAPKPRRNVSRSRSVIGAFRRARYRRAARRSRQHLAVGQLGQPPVHRLVEPEPALLDQDHRRRGGDRLGHRGDAEDRVAPHRRARRRTPACRSRRHASRRAGSPA